MTRPDVRREAIRKMRQSDPPETPGMFETPGDAVKFLLVVILLAAAFYSAALVVASMQLGVR